MKAQLSARYNIPLPALPPPWSWEVVRISIHRMIEDELDLRKGGGIWTLATYVFYLEEQAKVRSLRLYLPSSTDVCSRRQQG